MNTNLVFLRQHNMIKFLGGFLAAIVGLFAVPAVAANYRAPTSVTVVPGSIYDTSVRITWVGAGGPGSNFLVAQSNDGKHFTTVAYLPIDTSAYTFTGLNPNTEYWFGVAQGDSSGAASSFTATGLVYTAPHIPLPPIVEHPSANSIMVSVDSGDGNDPLITNYSIQELTSGLFVQSDGSLGTDEVFRHGGSTQNIVVKGLASNTTYGFRSRAEAVDFASFTPFSPVAYQATLAEAPAYLKAVETTDKEITLSWQGSAHSYLVVSSDSLSSGWIFGNSFTFKQLKCNHSYDFRVEGRNRDGVTTAWTDWITVFTQPCSRAVSVGSSGAPQAGSKQSPPVRPSQPVPTTPYRTNPPQLQPAPVVTTSAVNQSAVSEKTNTSSPLGGVTSETTPPTSPSAWSNPWVVAVVGLAALVLASIVGFIVHSVRRHSHYRRPLPTR